MVEKEVKSIPKEEKVMIGADLIKHVGEGNGGDEDRMEGWCQAEKQMMVDFAKNAYFRRREEHRVTDRSGGRWTQAD